ncbi:MAG: GTP-binding protein TypA [Elusimicrobia bacterium RIFOXYA2_FULL_39_19]|nr:MAG: GTP-binding protein TypA [Elusimicrobia bacterium RIFOXYA2_FULL_39_19]
MKRNESIRNIAIIAHVDHGKTTLVDHMLKQSGMFGRKEGQEERIMDNLDLEKERGITITAKNCSILWKGVKINIIDTPGHADFGGEVERGLKMADGAILLVDAAEGPLAQTRYVLKKALETNKKIIVAINKIDRKDARPRAVLDEIYQLFMDLESADHHINFPIFYCIGRDGIAQKTLETPGTGLDVLFDAVLEHIPAPVYDPAEPFQMLVCDLSYSDYFGRLAIGKVINGTAKNSDELVCLKKDGKIEPLQVTKIQVYSGIELKEAQEVIQGDIVIMAGIEDVVIGDTICTKENPKVLARIDVDEPTLSMLFGVNTSPFAGREGKLVQSRKIYERLKKETLMNVAIQIESTQDSNSFIVKGRGEFQMEILIETMVREGFELSIGSPKIIFKKEHGKVYEPIECLSIDCSDTCIGIITEKLSGRKGRMENMINHGTGRVRMEFTIPSRSLIGYRNEFIVDTAGTGVINSYLKGYEEYRGNFSKRATGSLVADREGKAVSYALHNLEPRGTMFIVPGEKVYEGMIVGEHSRDNDLDVNPCKEKNLTNMRSSTSDYICVLAVAKKMNLGQAIDFIKDDEIVEVTPLSVRLRKSILSAPARKRVRGEQID